MQKKRLLNMLVLSVFLLGGCIAENSLITEIEQLERPKPFDQLNVNSIVGKYIKIGSTKDDVIQILRSFDFSVHTKQRKKTLSALDEAYLVGTYDFKRTFSAMTEYRVVVEVSFAQNRTKKIKASYLKHMF